MYRELQIIIFFPQNYSKEYYYSTHTLRTRLQRGAQNKTTISDDNKMFYKMLNRLYNEIKFARFLVYCVNFVFFFFYML